MNLNDGTGSVDFERILPAVINDFLPVGLVGLLLAGLLGAFMSTFSGTLNAAQAYIINDIYVKYVDPKASTKKIMSMNYLVGVVVVGIGVFLGFFIRNVNEILQFIVSALYGGYIASNVLKWHWWRFNASGFFLGNVIGNSYSYGIGSNCRFRTYFILVPCVIRRVFGWLNHRRLCNPPYRDSRS